MTAMTEQEAIPSLTYAELEAMYHAQCRLTDEWADKHRAEVERKADATLTKRIAELESSLAQVNARLGQAQAAIQPAVAAAAAAQPTEADRLVEELVKLHESKKPGGGVHGQVIGCEPYVIRSTGFGLEALLDAARFIQNATAAPAQAATDEVRDKALRKINDIRNSIVGLQSLNWSEHVYPLVAALDEAGYVGMEYPEARKYYGTLLERAVKAEDELAALRTASTPADDSQPAVGGEA